MKFTMHSVGFAQEFNWICNNPAGLFWISVNPPWSVSLKASRHGNQCRMLKITENRRKNTLIYLPFCEPSGQPNR
ncbi:unnamed protein product, partial [Nesidiocoris tenuis]